LQKGIANAPGGAVVAFAESGGENKNFFHVGIGRREFNGKLRGAKYTCAK
jgi:hypothetical protein